MPIGTNSGVVATHYAPKVSHVLVLGAVVFFIAATLLWLADVYPEPRVSAHERDARGSDVVAAGPPIEASPEEAVETGGGDAPVRIVIDAIDVDATILNPASRDIAVLDEALRSGVVHYPGSGDLADETNMFLFGHSSGLPVVHNQNYKVFNNLRELESGNLIRVQSEGEEHVYRVTRVRLTEADEAYVEFATGKKQLTLSTCNSFGAESERWVVEADFIGSYPLVEKHDGQRGSGSSA